MALTVPLLQEEYARWYSCECRNGKGSQQRFGQLIANKYGVEVGDSYFMEDGGNAFMSLEKYLYENGKGE